jgi:hypothetical protein
MLVEHRRSNASNPTQGEPMNESTRSASPAEIAATTSAIGGAFAAICRTITSIPHAVSAEEFEAMNRQDGELISSEWFALRLAATLEATPGITRI